MHVLDVRHQIFESAGDSARLRDIAFWKELRANMDISLPGFARFTPQELRRRWLEGQAVVAVDLTQIVAYTSVVPVPIGLPDTRVFEASSGWTRPGWRRKGLQVRLRRHLYRDMDDALLISFGVGLGAAYVLRELGWNLYSWPDKLGVSDFIGKVADGKLHHRLGDAIDLRGREPFRFSDPVDLDHHDWDRYLHLWVSDAERAARLRQRLLKG